MGGWGITALQKGEKFVIVEGCIGGGTLQEAEQEAGGPGGTAPRAAGRNPWWPPSVGLQ